MAQSAPALHEHHVPQGWPRWLYSTNHQDIRTMYLVVAILGRAIGGILSIGARPCPARAC